ncbi:MAG: MMPL family transporter [Pseudomonadota bacterium]|nr:MMPL family transporter [Pseudomonadota bacterium]
MKGFIFNIYRRCIQQSLVMFMVIIALCTLAGYFTKQFTFDASADTLVAESDPDLLYYRKIVNYFGEEDFLFLTYKPIYDDLLSKEAIEKIDLLSRQLREIEGVAGVDSVVDAPLLKSPPIPLSELATGFRTLKSEDVNLKMAHQELTTSPLFKNLLISDDGKTTLIRIRLEEDEELRTLIKQRDLLRLKPNKSDDDYAQLKKVESAYRVAKGNFVRSRDVVLEEVREIRDDLKKEAVVHLGGVTLVASDMIRYVKSDITTFGASVLGLIILVLFAFFRRLRWVFIPIATTAITILITVGILGFIRQPATVISSNFVSLLSITTISFTIHLINKYHELIRKYKNAPHEEIIVRTMREKVEPCLYTSLTTIVAFGSLMTSDIIPVIDFGWIMCLGVMVAFFVTYSFFAVALMLIPKGTPTNSLDTTPKAIRLLCKYTIDHTQQIIKFTFGIGLISVVGMALLSLDSRFIDYFKKGTEINEGLVFIDKNFGGTIPLDIVIKFPPYVAPIQDIESDFFSDEEDLYPERYWFTPDKIEVLNKMQNYLDTRPEVGKVVSLATLESVARNFNEGQPLGAVELVSTLSLVPESIRKDLIEPYAAPDQGLMRITTRIHETGEPFSRDELIQDIKDYAVEELNIAPEDIHVTGMTVLFNGMLKKLFSSQASTLLFVIGATFLMFWILLRSARLAIIGLIPNILAAMVILAIMGFAGIPLDMMTITIAAIIVGIGVDDAIHYLYRFKAEFKETADVKLSVKNSHDTIGSALYFTSITVVIGFSVLAFSNFIPTVYFGILTAIAMILALLANLTILPSLLVKYYK